VGVPVTSHPTYSADRPTAGCHVCATCDSRCACPGCTAPTVQLVRMPAQPSPDLPDSLRRDRTLHMAAARAELVVEYPGQDCSSSLVAARAHDPGFRAAVDEAVRLTEQRVRAEIAAAAEQPRYIPFRDPLPESVHQRVLLTPEMFFDYDADGQLVGMGTTCGATALMRALGAMAPDLLTGADDLAAMTARAEGAEARAWRAGYHAAVAELQGVYWRTGSPAAQWAGDYLDAQTPYVERRARGAGPETGLSSTETGVQATVEGRDANGPQDGSGGTA
jgi:hypothetical protein